MATASRSLWMSEWESDLSPSPAAGRSAARAAARMHSSRYYGREATARLPQPTVETEKSRALPELKVVTRRRPRWGVALVVLAFVGLVLGASVVAPVLVTSAARGVEAKVGELETKQQELTAAATSLSAQISTLSAPDRVAGQATQLGLGPAQSVHYVQSRAGMAATEGDSTVAGR